MTEPKPKPARAKPVSEATFEDRVLLGFVAAATIAMAWISWPFFGAILWALVVTIAFAPVHDRLALMMPKRRNTVSPRSAGFRMSICFFFAFMMFGSVT